MQGYQKIGVIDGGKMSAGLCVLLTCHGCPTVLLAADGTLEEFDAYYQELLEEGLLSDREIELCKGCLTVAKDMAELKGCDLILECGETLEEKGANLSALGRDGPELVLSMTTTLLPEEILAQCPSLSGKLLAAHVAELAHIIPLVELMGEVSPACIEKIRVFFEDMGRRVVKLKKPVRGFLSTHLYHAICRESLYLAENGYGSARDVDTATKYSILPRYTAIGPFEGTDNASIDLTMTTTGHLFPLFVNTKEAPGMLMDAVAEGRTGSACGEGIYHWDHTAAEDLKMRIKAPWWKFFHAEVPVAQKA